MASLAAALKLKGSGHKIIIINPKQNIHKNKLFTNNKLDLNSKMIFQTKSNETPIHILKEG